MSSLNICLVSSEVAPFAKTGGLADVTAAITRYLDRQGHDVLLLMPMYGRVRSSGRSFEPHPALQDVPVRLGERQLVFSVSTAPLPESRARVHFVRCPELYGGDEIYTSRRDEPLRFALLAHAALAACQWLQWRPDVIHCNDWHTGLLPLYLRLRYGWDKLFDDTKTVLTIHNLGYQGVFSQELVPELGLDGDRHLLHREDLAEGRINFLKTGLIYADAITTVSETYAREIQSPELGMGLDDVLRARRESLVGIVNGVDYGEWNPETDELIPVRYSARDLDGKRENKRRLLADFGLAFEERAPLFGIVSRLTAQKGFDLLPDVLPALLRHEDARLIALGTGDEEIERFLQRLLDAFRGKVGVYRGYDEALAHRIEAASDVFLMPSRYEPCGLNQMYSLRYGTLPIVRRTGGLADTVRDLDEHADPNGFVFDEFTPQALGRAIQRALAAYRDPETWSRLVRNAMAADWSWDRQGRHYVDLYRTLLAS